MRDFYQEIIGIIGSGGETCYLTPIGDPARENAAHTTVTTKGVGALDGLVFAYQPGARTAFAKPTEYIRNQFRTANVLFNNSNEFVSTPDIDALSRDDGSGEGFSCGGIEEVVSGSAETNTVIGKYDSSSAREWLAATNTSSIVRLNGYDQSAAVSWLRAADFALPDNISRLLVWTYDGSGGVSAADGAKIYAEGREVASTATNNASYVSMDNTAALGVIGGTSSGNNTTGKISVPFFTYRVLNGVEIQNLNDIYVAMQRAQRSRLLAGVL